MLFYHLKSSLEGEKRVGEAFNNYYVKSQFFRDFVPRNPLLNLGFISLVFTWCNG